jgi:hypothetical protein
MTCHMPMYLVINVRPSVLQRQAVPTTLGRFLVITCAMISTISI